MERETIRKCVQVQTRLCVRTCLSESERVCMHDYHIAASVNTLAPFSYVSEFRALSKMKNWKRECICMRVFLNKHIYPGVH